MSGKRFILFLLFISVTSYAQNAYQVYELKKLPNVGSATLTASPDGSYLAAGNNNQIQLFNRASDGFVLGELIYGFSDEENPVTHIQISYDGNLLAAVTQDALIHVFKRNGNTIKKISTLNGLDHIPDFLSFSADGTYFSASNKDNKSIIWQISGGTFTKISSLNDVRDLCFSPTDPGCAYSNGKMYKFTGGKLSTPKKLPTSVENMVPDVVTFSPDGNYFACLYYTDNDNLAIWKKQADGTFKQFGLIADQNWGSFIVEFSSDSKFLTIYNKKGNGGIQKFIVYSVGGSALNFETEIGSNETMERMQFLSDGSMVALSSKQNILLYSVKGMKGNKFYKAKPVVVNTAVASTEEPEPEPGPVSDSVPVVSTVVVNSTPVSITNITNIFWLSPNPDIMNGKPVVAEKSSIEIQCKIISDKKISSEDIKIIINGKEVGKSKFNEMNLHDIQQEQLHEYTYSNVIPLEITADNINTIEIMANGKKCSKPVKVLYSAAKPNLHILAIGTSLDLQFPKKDAQDFANLFKTQGGSETTKLFGSVDVKTLIGAEATTNAIKESIERFRYEYKTGGIGPRDVMLIFISSHGFIYQDEFRIQGDDFKDIYKETYSVAYNEITSRLKEVNCKKLIFLDACFSGGAKASVADINNAIKDLNTQAQGVTTFSSSSNDEYSYEDEKWQNGAFTYSIKEALTTNKADKDGNGIITVEELYAYVSAKVPQIVSEVKGKQQHPTMPISDLLKNTPVFVIEK